MIDPVDETQLLRLSDYQMTQAILGFTVDEARKIVADPVSVIRDMMARGRLRATSTGRYVKVRPEPPEPTESAPMVLPPRTVPALPAQGCLFERSA
jgi:hypothetical protein